MRPAAASVNNIAGESSQPESTVSTLSSTNSPGVTAVGLQVSNGLNKFWAEIKALWDDGASCNYLHESTFLKLKNLISTTTLAIELILVSLFCQIIEF